MQEKGVLPVTSSLGVLGCWASHTGSGSRSATGKDPCWLVGRGQGREVRPISRNLELCPALVKLQERRETAGINAGSWVCNCMPCTHGSAGLGMLSGILITRVRGQVIVGMQWRRWPDMVDSPDFHSQ